MTDWIISGIILAICIVCFVMIILPLKNPKKYGWMFETIKRRKKK